MHLLFSDITIFANKCQQILHDLRIYLDCSTIIKPSLQTGFCKNSAFLLTQNVCKYFGDHRKVLLKADTKIDAAAIPTNKLDFHFKTSNVTGQGSVLRYQLTNPWYMPNSVNKLGFDLGLIESQQSNQISNFVLSLKLAILYGGSLASPG